MNHDQRVGCGKQPQYCGGSFARLVACITPWIAEYSGQVDRHAPYCPIPLVGVPTADILLYPVEDHVADKVAAMGKIRRHGDQDVVSTRYRNVADLALFATTLP